MSGDLNTLLDLHIELANGFLLTAVLIDDQALPPRDAVAAARERADETDGESLVESPSSAEPDQDEAREPVVRGGVEGALVTPRDDSGPAHDLDPRRVIDAFAEAGIACSIMSPPAGESAEKTAERLRLLADRTDLLVTDWIQHNDQGERAQALLERILSGADENPRHRVVAVYTGETDLEGVFATLVTLLDRCVETGVLESDDKQLVATKGAARLVVIAKPEETVPDGQPDRRVQYEDLPARLSKEFAASTVALLRGAAVAALGAVRADTHRLLARMDAVLDAGLVGHRIGQVTPDDATEHVARLIGLELAAILRAHAVGSNAGEDAIGLWLRHIRPDADTHRFGTGIDDRGLSFEEIRRIVGSGLGDTEVLDAYNLTFSLKKALRRATELVTDGTAEARESDDHFSALMTVESDYADTDRSLRLGTVVADGEQRLVCVQPVCDSVRIEKNGSRSFPFAPLHAPKPSQSPDLIVPDEDGHHRVVVSSHPYEMRMIALVAGSDGMVTPMEDGSYPTENGPHLRRVAQLRPDHAQRVALGVGDGFSRIGVDEPEMLRRSAGP